MIYFFFTRYASAFLWDSGSTVGELTSATKHCNNIDIKQSRPYRIALASEDFGTYFYEGPPFKIKHNKYVSCLKVLIGTGLIFLSQEYNSSQIIIINNLYN